VTVTSCTLLTANYSTASQDMLHCGYLSLICGHYPLNQWLSKLSGGPRWCTWNF